MSYYGVYMQCIKFPEVWWSNVHDVQKICLETTLHVNACFVEFYVFVLETNHVVGTTILCKHIWVGNILV